MTRPALFTLATLLASTLAGCAGTTPQPTPTPSSAAAAAKPTPKPTPGDAPMRLGNFSVSLAVKDINASLDFYQKLGFKKVAGNPAQKWVILQNETSTIGLHQGGIARNTLTYNPGWDRACNTLPDFDDIRELQKAAKAKGLTPSLAADETTSGPASFILIDPDGNPILFDQHVPSPHK